MLLSRTHRALVRQKGHGWFGVTGPGAGEAPGFKEFEFTEPPVPPSAPEGAPPFGVDAFAKIPAPDPSDPNNPRPALPGQNRNPFSFTEEVYDPPPPVAAPVGTYILRGEAAPFPIIAGGTPQSLLAAPVTGPITDKILPINSVDTINWITQSAIGLLLWPAGTFIVQFELTALGAAPWTAVVGIVRVAGPSNPFVPAGTVICTISGFSPGFVVLGLNSLSIVHDGAALNCSGFDDASDFLAVSLRSFESLPPQTATVRMGGLTHFVDTPFA